MLSVDLIFTPVDLIFIPLDAKGEDSVTACSKDVTIENESENTKNKKKKENSDETDGETVQMVIVNKKDTNTKNTITKDKNSKDKNTVTKDTNTKDTNTKDKKDEVDGQTGQIVAAAKASSLKINKVLSRLRLMFILILFDADVSITHVEADVDADTNFDVSETKVQRPNGTGEGGVERRKADKGISDQTSQSCLAVRYKIEKGLRAV